MSPTRRDILKLSAGLVAASLVSGPVVAKPEPGPTWTIVTPMVMECSDGRRWVFLPTEDHTLVNVYDADDEYDEYRTVRINGEQHQPVWDELTAMTGRLAKVLALAGVA